MSSPSSARVHASSSKIRSSRRDVNPSASRSRVFGASSVSNSSRAVNGTAANGGGRAAARVYLDGADVTPQSLLMSRIKPSSSQDQRTQSKPKGRARGKPSGGSVMGASVILSQEHYSTSSIDDSDSDAPPVSNQKAAATSSSSTTNQGAKPPVAAKAAAIPVVASPVVVVAAPTALAPEDDEGGGGADSVDGSVGAEAASKMLADITQTPTLASVVNVTGATATAAKPEKKVRRPVTIVMVETPTEMLFELRSLCVAQDASYHQAIAARNRQYVDVCAAKKGSDKFVEGRSQTLQLAQKTKEVMTAPPATRDSACTATDWDIFDCIRVEEDNQNDHDDSTAMDAAASSSTASGGVGGSDRSRVSGDPNEIGEAVLKQQVVAIVDATMSSPGCVLDVDGDIVDDLRARQHALRHARKHRQGHGNAGSQGNSQKSRVFHHSSGAPSQDYGRSSANVGNSSSSMASPSQSSGNVSFGASQDVVGGNLGNGEDSGASNSVANSQIGLSGGASQVLSNGSDGGKQAQNAYSRANTNVDLGEIIAQQRTGKVLASASLYKTVSVIERAVQQNVYHHQHVLYRNFPALSGSAASGSALEPHRKDKFGAGSDHSDWRSSIGMAADGSSSTSGSSGGGASSSMVPPINSFTTASGGGAGAALGGSIVGRNGKHALEKLWSFHCSLTEGRTVTCLAWNSVNEDLLAVAYARAAERPECPSMAAIGGSPTNANAPAASFSTPESTSSDDGLVLFWSLKNPEFPERVYNLDVGVTSIDFSRSHPYMLAVGFMNGVVAIYDTRKDDAQANPDKQPLHAMAKPSDGNQSRPPSAAGGAPGETAPATTAVHRHVPIPVATSETSSGKHLDAVWQVKWISKGSDRGENVVSISSDGRVTEWSMKKGLSFSDLMTLKRVANPLLGSDARADGGVISRQASGHCIDFATHDPSVYYVGTEDGIIHKCSVSYNEQYLQTYYGHTGPVYQILVSPFSSDLFLSCSADWNVKLWHQGDQKEALNFRSVNLQHAVLGISWCPSDAMIFGTVTEDGRIEIWDLQHSSLDPIITHYPKKHSSVSAQRKADKAGSVGTVGSTTGVFDTLDDLSGAAKDPAHDASQQQHHQQTEAPLECTKIAFAPSAPVVVVGDSTGNVTVYRVPVLTDRLSELLSVDDHIARLHRAMNPNNQE